MPIYEYKCDACGKRYEKIQKLGDPPCKKCPACDGALRKLISSPAIQFKGAGFYITDYPKKGKGGEDIVSAAKDEAGTGEAKAKGGKKDSKPAAETLPPDKPRPD